MERGKVVYSNDVLEQKLEELKEVFRRAKATRRTVKKWNYFRDNLKPYYPEQVISMLDGSGYIVKWMEGN